MPWRTVESNVRFGLEMQRRVDSDTAGQGRALHRDGRPDRLREVLPPRALRRHAAARRPGPRAGHRAPPAAHGRALRRRRRDDPRAHAGGAHQDRRQDRPADHLHHPRRRRGGHAGRPDRRRHQPPRADQGDHRRRPPAAAQPGQPAAAGVPGAARPRLGPAVLRAPGARRGRRAPVPGRDGRPEMADGRRIDAPRTAAARRGRAALASAGLRKPVPGVHQLRWRSCSSGSWSSWSSTRTRSCSPARSTCGTRSSTRGRTATMWPAGHRQHARDVRSGW